MVKLNIGNLSELKLRYSTKTTNYIYVVEPYGIGVYRLFQRKITEPGSGTVKAVKMPEIYRGYFKKWRWLD